MREFIHSTVNRVFSDFEETTAQAGSLCACKGLSYENGNSPDYDNFQVEQLYMLRFFPAYLAEYYLMYGKMLQSGFLPEQLNVLSIGCGCGVDLCGLKFAISHRGGEPDARIAYQGVDIANWHYQSNWGLNNAVFVNHDISQMDSLGNISNNVLVFPKSIGEFPPEVFENLRQTLENSSFSQDRVVVLCSLMNSGGLNEMSRLTRVSTALQSNGFRCLDNTNEYWHTPNCNGLSNICPGFDYPDAVKDQIAGLKALCPTYNRNGVSCEADCDCLNRWPILTARYIKYAFLRFER